MFPPSSHLLLILLTFRSEETYFLHHFSSIFYFTPQHLNHAVTFNVSQVLESFEITELNMHLDCGFMDGDNDSHIVNATSISVIVQEGMEIFDLLAQ